MDAAVGDAGVEVLVGVAVLGEGDDVGVTLRATRAVGFGAAAVGGEMGEGVSGG